MENSSVENIDLETIHADLIAFNGGFTDGSHAYYIPNHAALMARAPPSTPSRACARDLGHRARTWSLRPRSRRRFATADDAAADDS